MCVTIFELPVCVVCFSLIFVNVAASMWAQLHVQHCVKGRYHGHHLAFSPQWFPRLFPLWSQYGSSSHLSESLISCALIRGATTPGRLLPWWICISSLECFQWSHSVTPLEAWVCCRGAPRGGIDSRTLFLTDVENSTDANRLVMENRAAPLDGCSRTGSRWWKLLIANTKVTEGQNHLTNQNNNQFLIIVFPRQQLVSVPTKENSSVVKHTLRFVAQ